jgi:hypothetical protein
LSRVIPSSLREWPTDLIGVAGYVLKRYIDPSWAFSNQAAYVSHLWPLKDTKSTALAKGIDRLARDPKKRCGPTRRNEAPVEALKQLLKLGVARVALRLRHGVRLASYIDA